MPSQNPIRPSCLMLALAGAACTGVTEPERDFERAVARWNRAGLVNYSFRSSVSCFCGQEYTRPMTVTVRSGRVVSVTDRVSGAVRPIEYRDAIDSVFRRVATEIRVRPERLQVTYDAALGFPRTLTYGTPENDGGGYLVLDSVVVVP